MQASSCTFKPATLRELQIQNVDQQVQQVMGHIRVRDLSPHSAKLTQVAAAGAGSASADKENFTSNNNNDFTVRHQTLRLLTSTPKQ